MSQWLRDSAFCFSAGAVGGLARAVAAWACARHGWDDWFGVQWSGSLSASTLYPRVVWGGLWALLFLLPRARGSLWVSGLLWALVVTLVQLVFLPLILHTSLHFALFPALALLLLNCVWGLVTAFLLHLLG